MNVNLAKQHWPQYFRLEDKPAPQVSRLSSHPNPVPVHMTTTEIVAELVERLSQNDGTLAYWRTKRKVDVLAAVGNSRSVMSWLEGRYNLSPESALFVIGQAWNTINDA